MDWLSFLGGMGQASGQMSAQGVNAQSNPAGVSDQGGAWAQQAMQGAQQGLFQQQGQMMQQDQEFGTQGMPPSLQQAVGQNNQQIDQMVAQTPQAEFGQFMNPGVLPPMGAIPDQQPIQPTQQQYPAGGGQQMPQAQGFAPMPGGQQPPAQTNFSDLFNMTGSAPSSPGSEQGFNPNMFLRMSEGYNRGGMLGALGMLLTDYK
jgi:hypothetical protein